MNAPSIFGNILHVTVRVPVGFRIGSWLTALAMAGLLLSNPAMAADRLTGKSFATRSEVLGVHGMAATSHPLATQIAVQILRDGGTAVDAAIAANAALGLMEPVSCGIGGDLFAMVWLAGENKLYGYNGSGRSPRALTIEEFQRLGITRIPARGALPVSVPGCVDGWFALHERFGRLPMSRLLEPAIDYAEEGFPVTETIAYYWEKSVAALGQYPGFKAIYAPAGRAPRAGEIFRNPALAETYRRLAEGGRAVFYDGLMAERMDAFMRANGGYLRREDLAAHRGEWVAPVSTNYRGYDVWALPPNGQGIATLQILNILEGFDLRAMGRESADYLHLFVEAKKLAFADRARFYADPDFAQIPLDWLISKEYADQRRALIDRSRAARVTPSGTPPPEQGDTIYLTVADAAGNMVSLIQSNYRGHGSGMCPEGLGFCLQNRGESFTFEAGHANRYAPGKRPFHTIIPGFISKAGRPWVSFGVMGGATQPQGQAQVVVNLIDFDLRLQEAGDAPRIVHTGSPEPTGEGMTGGGVVCLESGFPWETIRTLQDRGHQVSWSLGDFGGYQAIRRDFDNGVYAGASESRKDGQAAGY